MKKSLRLLGVVMVGSLTTFGITTVPASAAKPVTMVTLTATGATDIPYCSLTSTLTLASAEAKKVIGGHIDFTYYIWGGSYDGQLFSGPRAVQVPKRTKSVIDGPLEWGFSSGFSYKVNAVGYDSQDVEVFDTLSSLVPIPSSC